MRRRFKKPCIKKHCCAVNSHPSGKESSLTSSSPFSLPKASRDEQRQTAPYIKPFDITVIELSNQKNPTSHPSNINLVSFVSFILGHIAFDDRGHRETFKFMGRNLPIFISLGSSSATIIFLSILSKDWSMSHL